MGKGQPSEVMILRAPSVLKSRGHNRQVRDAEGGPIALSIGWHRRNHWTLRCVDSALEREYEAAMAVPGTQRLRIAHLHSR